MARVRGLAILMTCQLLDPNLDLNMNLDLDLNMNLDLDLDFDLRSRFESGCSWLGLGSDIWLVFCVGLMRLRCGNVNLFHRPLLHILIY